MKKTLFKGTALVLLTTCLLHTISFGQANKPAINYLNVAGPIIFDQQVFNLSWSSHPSGNFYKQEFIVKGDAVEKYKTMVLMDVVTGESNIKDVVGAKLNELKKLKETNPVVNYEAMDNPKNGEYIIDFLLSANTPDGKNIRIIERNVYRYKTFTDKSGQKGILLFGVSVRGYDAGVTPFLTALKTNRKSLVNKVAQFKIPEITISR